MEILLVNRGAGGKSKKSLNCYYFVTAQTFSEHNFKNKLSPCSISKKIWLKLD